MTLKSDIIPEPNTLNISHVILFLVRKGSELPDISTCCLNPFLIIFVVNARVNGELNANDSESDSLCHESVC